MDSLVSGFIIWLDKIMTIRKNSNKIKVLIVDDSAIMRQFLTDVISSSSEMEVVGTSIDPYFAINKIQNLQPDVLTLDVQMPRMDGLTFLSKLMTSYPMPVVMVSNFTAEGSQEAIKAMQLGAIDFIQKPVYGEISSKEALLDFTRRLLEKIKIASKTKVKKDPVLVKDILVKKIEPSRVISNKVLAIGASTGGVAIISDILSSLKEKVPAIVIVQHMPEGFTRAFADRVNMISKIHVKEAEQGDRLYQGTALIAPGSKHIVIRKADNGYIVEINDDPPLNRHRPSVDKLFDSVADAAGNNGTGIILTGMGDDGARGLLKMKSSGARTIAQDKESSIIFGMPYKAIEIGAADEVMSIEQIINYINRI